MKKPVVIVGIVLTLACASLYIVSPNILSPVSRAFYDALQRFHPAAVQADAVAVVDLDDRSLAEHGQWPWPRYKVAGLVDRILAAGAKVVALDIVFPERDRTSPVHMRQAMDRAFGIDVGLQDVPEDLQDFDRILARSLASGSTILSMYMHGVDTPSGVDETLDGSYKGRFFTLGSGDPSRHLFQSETLTLSIPELSGASANNAFFNVLPDADNVVRSAPLVWAFGPRRIYPSVALESVRLYLGVPQVGIEIERDGVSCLRLGDRRVPTDGRGRLLINYRAVSVGQGGREQTFPTVSASDVLSGRAPRAALAGRIVFIGTSAAGLRDLRATPLSSEFSGVEIQATIADNLLAGDFLSRPSWMTAVNLLIILVAGLFITLATQAQRSWLAFTTVTGCIALCLAVSLRLYSEYRIVFIPDWSIFSMAVIYPVLTMVGYWRAERHERWMRNAFGSMVSRKVLSYLEEHPEAVALTRDERAATVLFSDLAGFSRIAESMDPVKLSRMLQDYLGEMTRIIMARDGYVDKYIGDMIMAEWGVPYPIDDHAAQACHAALEQVALLDRIRPRLRAAYGHDLHMRIGINTGAMIAGNMGSAQRFQYTVLGDAVNLASRLEPLNKEFGTTILIGPETYRQVRDQFDTRMLDRVSVAGKDEQVLVYELMARKGGIPEQKRRVVSLYEEALRLYWEGKWDEPFACLQHALKIDPQDEPTARLYERITGMKFDMSVVESAAETPSA